MDRDQEEKQRGSEPSWRLISEPIVPLEGSFDREAMSRGEPGLPSAFRWRRRIYRIDSCLQAWKVTGPEPGSRQRYVRRHAYRLRMEDGATWEIYLLRQPVGPRGRGNRWYLFRIRP